MSAYGKYDKQKMAEDGGRSGRKEAGETQEKQLYRLKKRLAVLGAVSAATLLAAVILLVLLIGATAHTGRPAAVSAGDAAEPAREDPVSKDGYERMTFTAVGDNLIHGAIYEEAAARAGGSGYDFGYAYEPVRSFFLSHDVNWINMETIVNNRYEPSGYPWFSTPGADAETLYDTGFRIFSLCSNHTYDYGSGGVEAMTDFYENEMPSDILTTGVFTDTDRIPVYTCKGHTIAFLTYTYGTNEEADPEYGRVIYLGEEELIERQITKAKEEAECVIVSCHWGDENCHGINDEQRAMAGKIADWGADIIIGTHPHVVQDYVRIETSDARLVPCIYSLGNFISAQKGIDQLTGLVFECTLAFPGPTVGGKNVKVEDVSLIPVVTHYDSAFENLRVMFLSDYTPELAERHGVNEYEEFSYPDIFSILEKYVINDALKLPEEK